MTIRHALAVTAIGGLVFGGLAFAAVPTKLAGTVGPGFTISLKNAAKQKVVTLKPGSYLITVQDKADIHDFHLTGPGVSKEIGGVGFKGIRSATVTLKAGKYKYFCTVHLFQGTFTVK